MESLQAALNVLKFGSDGEAAEALRDLRQTVSETVSTTSEQGTTAAAVPNDLLSLDDTTHDPQVFSARQLPPEFIVQKAAKQFFDMTAGVFWVIDKEDFDALMNTVFRSNTPPPIENIAEVCAIAAAGYQYESNPMHNGLLNALYGTALRYLPNLIECNSARAARYLSLLAACGLAERPKTTRAFIQLALKLAWWATNDLSPSTEIQVLPPRVHRTLIFLEW